MTKLWSVNSLGKVFTLATDSQHWEELPGHEGYIKRVSAHPFFTWAISGDHQVCVYVNAQDVPIRCRVVTYENERWNPVHGFSSKLLPTDRAHWSSADGLTALPLDSFHLPSDNWQWEGEWYVENNLEGQPLELEGWTYAADFPATYGPSKSWNSFVRRRKWVRYRRFVATNSWASVPSIHMDPIQEPFIDIAVGGTDIPGGDSDKFAIWAVTILGRVIYRYGVTMSSPEGSGWVPIDTPEGSEVHQISVGPTGLLWALSWEGSALVRFGVTRENAIGDRWLKVEPPNNEKLLQVSVGTNVIWAVTRDTKVWFRKGIRGLNSSDDETAATGTGWIEMVGSMMMVSVGLNDQVWAFDTDGQVIYIRTGVVTSELSGRTWKPITASLKSLHRMPSLSSLDSHSSSSTQKDSDAAGDDVSLRGSLHRVRNPSTASCRSSPVPPRGSLSNHSSSASFSNVELSEDSYTSSREDIERKSICALDGGSYSGDFPSEVWDSGMEDIGGVARAMHDDFIWIWISSSGCMVDPDALPPWFSAGLSRDSSGPGEPWYDDLITKFKERESKECSKFKSIPRAIEKSVWVKTGSCEQYNGFQWIKCLLEFEQHGGEKFTERGLLRCHYKNEMVSSLNLKDIVVTVRYLDKKRWTTFIHTASSLRKLKPLIIAFSSEENLEDWVATLNKSCCSVHHGSMRPDKQSIWSTTVGGDVYVHNSAGNAVLDDLNKMFWFLLGGGHLRIVETCPFGVTWGIGYNCTAWVYTKGYGGGPYRGISGSNVSIGPMSDTRNFFIYENQRWNPLTGFSAKGLPTDRWMWSDVTGRYECSKTNTQLPCNHWQWISDWCIDYKAPGGVDNQGWQYAIDFPRTYHAYKSFTDYVRRRRWVRKCRLLTSGPWKQLGTTQLLDVSFQMDSTADVGISVWGVATNGDVLRRVEVTTQCPEGKNWIHIPAEKSFRSISVGVDNAVWGVTTDGCAQLRHGISAETPNGLFWCHVEPPEHNSGKCRLRQISAGKLAVLSVDENNRLWSRQEIVEIFKEGTHWKLVAESVKQVSVNQMDEIWAVLDSYQTPAGTVCGVVAKRVGLTPENIYGTDWNLGIGENWNHVCVRGIHNANVVS